MLGLHAPELFALLGIVVLVLGAKRLPEMGSSVGKTITEFRKSMREISEPDDQKPAEAATPALPAPRDEVRA